MSSTVEVVGQAEGEAVAQVALDGQEDRIGSIQGLKLLLVWLVEKIRIRLRKGRGRALGLIHESLKDRDGVQVGRVTGSSAGASPGERQLPAA